MTVSEQLFRDHCALLGCSLRDEPVQPNVRKTVDFCVQIGSCEIFVEVKEWVGSPATSLPGLLEEDAFRRAVRHVRLLLEGASVQLRSYRACNTPLLAVLYDRRTDVRTPLSLDPAFMAAVLLQCPTADSTGPGKRVGRQPIFQATDRQFVSAVSVLSTGPHLDIYHNPFARLPLPIAPFPNAANSHFAMAAASPAEWTAVTA